MRVDEGVSGKSDLIANTALPGKKLSEWLVTSNALTYDGLHAPNLCSIAELLASVVLRG